MNTAIFAILLLMVFDVTQGKTKFCTCSTILESAKITDSLKKPIARQNEQHDQSTVDCGVIDHDSSFINSFQFRVDNTGKIKFSSIFDCTLAFEKNTKTCSAFKRRCDSKRDAWVRGRNKFVAKR